MHPHGFKVAAEFASSIVKTDVAEPRYSADAQPKAEIVNQRPNGAHSQATAYCGQQNCPLDAYSNVSVDKVGHMVLPFSRPKLPLCYLKTGTR
jgi:hypothetical protein